MRPFPHRNLNRSRFQCFYTVWTGGGVTVPLSGQGPSTTIRPGPHVWEHTRTHTCTCSYMYIHHDIHICDLNRPYYTWLIPVSASMCCSNAWQIQSYRAPGVLAGNQAGAAGGSRQSDATCVMFFPSTCAPISTVVHGCCIAARASR